MNMQHEPIISPEGIMKISNTSLEYFTTCARSAEYYLLRQRRIARPASALTFGAAIHEALALFHTKYESQGPDSWAGFFQEAEKLLIPYFQEVPEDEWRTLERAQRSLASYLASLDEDSLPLTPLVKDGGFLAETSFEVPIGEVEFNHEFQGVFHKNLKVIWKGRFDLIVEHREKLWVVDHKTTSFVGPSFFLDFENSSQTLGYTWAAEKILGRPVEGLLLNALVIRKPTKTGVGFELQRKYFPYCLDRVNEWAFNTLTLVSDFLSHLKRGYFPMETKWCVGKYGPCQYLDVCTLAASQRETMLASNFYENVQQPKTN